MAKFHINPETGNVSSCSAVEGNCPFDSEHYDTEAEAREAFEQTFENPFANPKAMENAKNEVLHEELELYITDGPFGRFLNHPLVQDMFVDAMPGMANARFKQKKAAVADAIEKKAWGSYLFLHERPYRFDALVRAIDDHGLENPSEHMESVWVDSENIHQNYDQWGELIREYGFTMDENDAQALKEMPDRITIYRGCSKEGDEGYSWTTDYDKAQWFADRFEREDTRVIEGVIAKERVKAYFAGRGESEIIALPEDVEKIS